MASFHLGGQNTSSDKVRVKCFTYSQHTWEHICVNVLSHNSFHDMKVTIRGHPCIGEEQLEKIILGHFNRFSVCQKLRQAVDLSELSVVVPDAHELIKTCKAKGDKYAHEEMWAEAILAYEICGKVMDAFISSASELGYPLLDLNAAESDRRDVARMQCSACNLLVNSRCDGETMKPQGVNRRQLETAVCAGSKALDWAWVHDWQRAEGHFYRGIAHTNLGDWLEIHCKSKDWKDKVYVESRHEHHEAGQDMYFADRLLPGDETVAAENLKVIDGILGQKSYTKGRMHRHIIMGEHINGRNVQVWDGDTQLRKCWGLDHYHGLNFLRVLDRLQRRPVSWQGTSVS